MMFRRNEVLNRDNSGGMSSSGTTSGMNVISSRNDENPRYPLKFREFLGIFVKFCGIFTATVLGGVGVDLVYHRHYIGYYEIGGAIFILLLELLWVVTAFLFLFVRPDHSIWRWWSKILWLEGWKKSILYGPMAAVPLIWPQKLWLSYVASGLLLFLSLIHFLMSLKKHRRKKRRGNLLNGDIDSIESRVDEGTDTMTDHHIPEPFPGSSLSLADSLTAVHDSFMEI